VQVGYCGTQRSNYEEYTFYCAYLGERKERKPEGEEIPG
jgi:hypothetical protein